MTRMPLGSNQETYGSPFSEGTVMGIFWALAALVERQSQLRAASTPAPPPRWD